MGKHAWNEMNNQNFVPVKILPESGHRKEGGKLHNEIRAHSDCVTQFDEQQAEMIWEALHTLTGPNVRAIRLIWKRDGGTRILQIFQIRQKSELPSEHCKVNPQRHTHSRRKREKWPLSTQFSSSLSHQHVRQSGKVCGVLLALCCMFCIWQYAEQTMHVHVFMWYVWGLSHWKATFYTVFVWLLQNLSSLFSTGFFPLVLYYVSHCQSAH